jgi:pimeloyl-ACP methyl ester carboxylesterase
MSTAAKLNTPDQGSTRLGTFKYKTIDGLRVRYATSEETTGTPVLLLSPWPESIYAYLPTWDVFSSLGPVVAIDLPGYGLSQSRPEIFAPESMGEFIRSAVSAFELHQPHAVGPDIGTPSLLYAAANHPGLFKSMIIGGGATDPSDIGDLLEEMVNAPSLERDSRI